MENHVGLHPTDFFDLRQVRHAHLFDGCDHAWQALERLPVFISETIKPNTGRLGNSLNPVIARTTVLYHQEILTEGFDIETVGDHWQVTSGGKLLDGASIIFQGAVLRTTAIELGNGVVIHPGALIEGPTILGDRTVLRPRSFLR